MCPAPADLLGPPDPSEVAADTLRLEAGRADLDAYGESFLDGGVRLRFADRELRSDSIRYDHPRRHAWIDSPLQFRSQDAAVEAAQAEIALGINAVDFVDTRFLLADGARGEAGHMAIDPSGLRLQDVAYSTCAGDDPAWSIEGREIRIDRDKGRGTARNIRLKFFRVPLLYLPWFQFPVSPERQTGLLFPQVGTSDATGFFTRWPLYINLHPQADVTLAPEYLSERGLVLGGQARGLWSRGQAQLSIRHLDEDRRNGLGRTHVEAQLGARLGSTSRAEIDWARVSDIDFLRDLGLEGGDSATNVLEQRVEMSWRPAPGVRARARALDFQILDPAISSRVFAREPELSLDYLSPEPWHGLQPGLRVEMVRFSDGDSTTNRLDLNTRLRWQQQGPGWQADAEYAWRATRYDLSDAPTLDRELPTVRAGVQMDLRRRLSSGLVQTLRPRLDYIYTPFRDQSALPLFDTSLPDFTLDQLRLGNRFSGVDRISDENSLIPSVESMLLDPISGIRRARLRLGLQLRLSDSRVTLPRGTSSEAGSSDWLFEMDMDAANGIRGRASGQYNTQESRFDALNIGGRFIGQGQRRIQLAYRFRRELFEQVDALALWPLGGRWTGAARWTWAIDESRSLETLAGLSYQSCCWGATVGLRRFVNGSAENFDTGVFVQLAFQGLGNFGRGFGELFSSDALSF